MISPAEMEDLKEAIKSELEKGKDADELKSEMIKAGYEESDIEFAFSRIELESSKTSEKPLPKLAVAAGKSSITTPNEKPPAPVITEKPSSVVIALDEVLKSQKRAKAKEEFFESMRAAPKNESPGEKEIIPEVWGAPRDKKRIAVIVIIAIAAIAVLYSLGFFDGMGNENGGGSGPTTPGNSGFEDVKPTEWECSDGTVIMKVTNEVGGQISNLKADGLTCIPHALANNGKATCIITEKEGCSGIAAGRRFESTITLEYISASGIEETTGTIWGAAG